jgi:hypothetical protein
MHPTLTKEFRALALPWVAVAAAGALAPLGFLVHGPSLAAHVLGFVTGLAGFAFCAGLALLPAVSFGAEFQQRTIALLLAQPCERAQLWNRKMLAVVLAIIAAALIPCVTLGLAWLLGFRRGIPTAEDYSENLNQCLLVVALVVGTICSANFWTLLARSTIGGMVFNAAFQSLIAAVASGVLQKVHGENLPFESPVVRTTIVILGSTYSAGLFLLGWRLFARLELRDALVGEGFEFGGAVARARWRPGWLICRPQGVWSNLLRKELRLQKPVFIITAVFLVCWFAVLGLNRLWPAEAYPLLLFLLLCFYVPLVLLLAGSVPLTEEKTLGVAAWQLTWPVATRQLWFVKLAVANVVGMVLGLVLPGLLALGTAPGGDQSGLLPVTLEDLLIPVLLVWGTVLLGFWAGTLASNAIRAVVTAIVAFVVGGFCVSLGLLTSEELSRRDWNLQVGLLTQITAHYQLPSTYLSSHAEAIILTGLFVPVVAWVCVLLRQSFIQFRQVDSPRRMRIKYAAVLGLLLFLSSFWAFDFVHSTPLVQRSVLVGELETACRAAVARQGALEGQAPQKLTVSDLESHAVLSDSTRTWLRNAVVTCQLVSTNAQVGLGYQIHILFSNGRQDETALFGISTPESRHWGLPGGLEK